MELVASRNPLIKKETYTRSRQQSLHSRFAKAQPAVHHHPSEGATQSSGQTIKQLKRIRYTHHRWQTQRRTQDNQLATDSTQKADDRLFDNVAKADF